MTLSPADRPRLARQLAAVLTVMADGKWRTFREIEDALAAQGIHAGHPSISARLRQARTHGYAVERRLLAPGLWAYRVLAAEPHQVGA